MPRQVDGLAASLACLGEGMTVGPYPELPSTALVVPILQPGTDKPTAVMVAGVSARLPMNEPYRDFYKLLATAVGAALANARAYEDERKKVEALAEIDRAKTAFFSNVSHEFRTPLTLLLGPLEDELAERDAPLSLPRRERLETAHRNAIRLLKLVNTLLDFSRIEAGRIEATYVPVDLATATEELASVFRSAVEKAGLAFVVDCPPLPAPVYVDREMWEKIVLNLLSNALKHTFDGSIEVHLQSDADHVRLSIADTGIGIRAADLPRLFERFHRVKGAKSRSHEGTGIGLALVAELTRLHGGSVSVESVEGKGSTFTVAIKTGVAHLPSLPIEEGSPTTVVASRAAGYLPEVQRRTMPPPAAEPLGTVDHGVTGVDGAAHSHAQRPRVLWVDDNGDMREYVRRLLMDHFDVTAFADGTSALMAARAEPPDLVLSDVMMPGLDGFGLLRELRSDEATRTIPVILLSARAGEEAIVEGLGTGADDYICKPFVARELVARVRTHVELARARRAWTNKLERANAELEEFVYIASHDLQEPLRMVRSYVQLLAKDYGGKLDADADRYIHYAVDGAARMQGLINDLLSLARLNSEAQAPVLVDTSEVVANVLKDLEIAIAESGAVITKDTLPVVMADRRQLSLVLQNLVANAIKFRRPGAPPRVHISAEHEQGEQGEQGPQAMWVFGVRDNGIGIDPKQKGRIFRMFQRLHTRTEYAGSGIGLAICKKAVERAGGRIWFDSTPGEGTSFRFSVIGQRGNST